jgi:hypothetical protein
MERNEKMTGPIEYAAGARDQDFPRHWGAPQGGTSEERTSWILRNIATDRGLERRGLNAAEARSGKRQNMSARLALAKALELS